MTVTDVLLMQDLYYSEGHDLVKDIIIRGIAERLPYVEASNIYMPDHEIRFYGLGFEENQTRRALPVRSARLLDEAGEDRRLATIGAMDVAYVIQVAAYESFLDGFDEDFINIALNNGTDFVDAVNGLLVEHAAELGIDPDAFEVMKLGVLYPVKTGLPAFGLSSTTTTTTTSSSTTTASSTTSTSTTTSSSTSTSTTTLPPFMASELPGTRTASVTLALVGIFALCCSCFALRFCYVGFCQRPKHGQTNSHIVDGKTDFGVVGSREGDTEVQREHADRTTTGKLHIIWDVDMARVKESPGPSASPWRSEDDMQSPSVNPLEMSGPPVTESAWRTTMRDADDMDMDFLQGTNLEFEDAAPEVVPFFENNAKVEYYSGTLSKWILGYVKVKKTKGGRGKPAQVIYHLYVKSGLRWQCRSDVRIDRLRPPLQDGDDVDVRIDKSEWTKGQVVGSSSRHKGVTVRLEGGADGHVVDGISLRCVRRRFEDGEHVTVYKGPTIGWVGAVVDSSAAPGEANSIDFGAAVNRACISSASNLSNLSEDVGFMELGVAIEEANPSTMSGASGMEGLDDGLWTVIAVREVKEDGEGYFVPTCLVRKPSSEEI